MLGSGDDERLEVLDENGLPTGETAPSSAVHATGAWHRALNVWLVNGGNVVLARPAPGDSQGPARLGPTYRCHPSEGEALPAIAERLERHLGLAVRPGQLEFIGTFRTDVADPEGGVIDREHVDAYVLEADVALEELVLDPKVIDTVYEVPLDRAVELFEDGRYVAVEGFDSMRRTSNALLVEEDLTELGRGALSRQVREVAKVAAGSGGGDG